MTPLHFGYIFAITAEIIVEGGTQMGRARRQLCLVVSSLCLIIATSAWVVPNQPLVGPVSAGQSSAVNFFDPSLAGARTDGTLAYMDGSDTMIGNTMYLLPELFYTLDSGTQSAPSSSIPGSAPGTKVSFNAAPSLTFVNGHYVLWWTGYSNSSPNCLYSEISPTQTNPGHGGDAFLPGFNNASVNLYCDTYNNNGLFDPSLFVAGNGTIWLLYASESRSGNAATQGIYVSQLDYTGMYELTQPQLLVSYSTISQAAEASGAHGPAGALGVIENPQFAIDPNSPPGTTAYDLTVSYGAYNYPYAYHTIETDCASITACNDQSNVLNLDSSLVANGPYQNPGAFSTIAGGTYSGHYSTFALSPSYENIPPNSQNVYRYTYVVSTNSPGYSEFGSPYLPGNNAVTYPSNDTIVARNAVNGYILIMQSDGNLVMKNQNGIPVWSTRTNGHPGDYLVMQNDGNLVVYTGPNLTYPIWASNSRNPQGGYAILQQDDNFVVNSGSSRPLYSTNTCDDCPYYVP